jgi:hypothetical protein
MARFGFKMAKSPLKTTDLARFARKRPKSTSPLILYNPVRE